MTDRPPPTDQQLDEYEALAAAATDGPWGVYQYGGDSLIEIAADLEDTGCGYQARRTVCRFDEEPLDNDPAHRDWTGEEDWAQVQADAAYIAAMSPETGRALVAEVRRLRAPADRVRALAILEAADFLRDAHHRDGLTVQEIGTALRHTADEADPMVGSLARDGFGLDEIADMLARPAVPAAVASDTLPAWLYQRFAVIHGCPPWDRATDRDRAYWEHQAAAVRRAVARGGFKTTEAAAVPAAGVTGE
jgi:hypothetical protein